RLRGCAKGAGPIVFVQFAGRGTPTSLMGAPVAARRPAIMGGVRILITALGGIALLGAAPLVPLSAPPAPAPVPTTETTYAAPEEPVTRLLPLIRASLEANRKELR